MTAHTIKQMGDDQERVGAHVGGGKSSVSWWITCTTHTLSAPSLLSPLRLPRSRREHDGLCHLPRILLHSSLQSRSSTDQSILLNSLALL